MLYQPHAWIEISKESLLANAAAYKRLIGTQRHLAAVIKANAYGHGLLEVATIYEQSPDVDWFCLAQLSNAVKLRKHGIKKPILIIGCLDTDPREALIHDIDIFLDSYQVASDLNAIGKQTISQFRVHVKVDTGLSRLGVTAEDAYHFVQHVRQLPYIAMQGVYSHFSQAQLLDDSFSHAQLDQFNFVIDQLKQDSIDIPYVHMANSAATLRFSLPQCNLFRIGAGLYGISPSQELLKKAQLQDADFYPELALTLKTRIMQIKQVSAQTYVGYNCTYQTTKNSIIAILPIGYQDGYSICNSNKANVIVNNQEAPVVGRVCMNNIMIDVSDIPSTRIGDEVLLIGNHPAVNAYTLSEINGNHNPREVLTTLNSNIERIVVNERIISVPQTATDKKITCVNSAQ